MILTRPKRLDPGLFAAPADPGVGSRHVKAWERSRRALLDDGLLHPDRDALTMMTLRTLAEFADRLQAAGEAWAFRSVAAEIRATLETRVRGTGSGGDIDALIASLGAPPTPGDAGRP